MAETASQCLEFYVMKTELILQLFGSNSRPTCRHCVTYFCISSSTLVTPSSYGNKIIINRLLRTELKEISIKIVFYMTCKMPEVSCIPRITQFNTVLIPTLFNRSKGPTIYFSYHYQ